MKVLMKILTHDDKNVTSKNDLAHCSVQYRIISQSSSFQHLNSGVKASFFLFFLFIIFSSFIFLQGKIVMGNRSGRGLRELSMSTIQLSAYSNKRKFQKILFEFLANLEKYYCGSVVKPNFHQKTTFEHAPHNV